MSSVAGSASLWLLPLPFLPQGEPCRVPEGNCKLLYLRLLITIPFQERRLEGPFIVHCRVVVLTEFGG